MVMPTKIIPPISLEQRIAERVTGSLNEQFLKVSELIATTNRTLVRAEESNQQLVSQVITAINTLNITLEKLLVSLSNLDLPFENPPQIASQVKKVTTVGTAVQLPPLLIPYDMEVVIKAPAGNTGTIYIGNSKPEAEDHTLSYPLERGEPIEYKIRNLSQLWIDSTVANEGIVWTVEQKGGE